MSEQSRRLSTVGDIGLGDNAGRSLSTMSSESAARASRYRQRALSGAKLVKSPSGKLRVVPEPQATGIRYAWLWYRELSYKNTWVTPLLLMAAIFGVYYLQPGEQNPLHRFLFLSYKIPGTDPVMYGKGPNDFAFVAFCMIFFTFFREFCMQVILKPIALKSGITKKAKVSRFIEQTYSIIYYGLSGPFGIYIMYHTPMWWFETKPMYIDFPHRSHEAMFKLFYLLQASFWAQQSVILMLQLEKPRKDFYELVFHHIVTIALIFLSYRFHFTWMGLVVYITMDVSDFFLATSKTLNYLDSAITGPFFLVFMSIWIYLRHYINLRILYSIATEFATVGDFTLNWDTQQYKCWISQYITFALLFALQLVNIYWLVLIIRIAYRVVFLDVVKDERSDDEDEEDEDYSSEESPVESKKEK